VKALLVPTTIDQIAASDASISELRDIVAANPGATQKPRSSESGTDLCKIDPGFEVDLQLAS
jgi:hypothetical protein